MVLSHHHHASFIHCQNDQNEAANRCTEVMITVRMISSKLMKHIVRRRMMCFFWFLRMI